MSTHLDIFLFDFVLGQSERVLCVVGGSGASALLQLLRTCAKDGQPPRQRLLTCAQEGLSCLVGVRHAGAQMSLPTMQHQTE
jgi:hypothetical protein